MTLFPFPWQRLLLLASAIGLAGSGSLAAPGDKPVAPLPATKQGENAIPQRVASLPARGLFQGDQLSTSAKERLTELIVEALSLEIEVALVVPTGPWKIDDKGQNERDLTPARLAAVRKFLADRGVDPKRIFIESRIDPTIKEPRLDLQMLGRPAND